MVTSGYIAMTALDEGFTAPTHWFTTTWTFICPGPDLNSPHSTPFVLDLDPLGF